MKKPDSSLIGSLILIIKSLWLLNSVVSIFLHFIESVIIIPYSESWSFLSIKLVKFEEIILLSPLFELALLSIELIFVMVSIFVELVLLISFVLFSSLG